MKPLQYVLTRTIALVISVVLAAILVFAIVRMLPGDAAGGSLGVGATAEQLTQMREELGLDEPVLTQFIQWASALGRGDAGQSFISGLPIADLVAAKLQVTVPLSLFALLLAVVISFPLGVIAAMRRSSPIGVAVSAFSQLGMAVPVFWIGVLLVGFFSLRLGVLPSGGFPRAGWSDPAAVVQALLLPVITVALAMSSVMVRYIRSATLDVLDQEYMRTARSLGFGRWQALARHGFRNALAPVTAILGIELATSMLGAVVVENVFALPGLGTLLLDSVKGRDLPVVQALVLGMTILVLVINLIVDLAQRALDPRLRLAAVGAS